MNENEGVPPAGGAPFFGLQAETRKDEEFYMSEKMNIAKIFGENVFSDKVMQERLPKKVYKELKKTMEEGKELDPMVAEVVAEAMKNWAVEKGATHYTHMVPAADRHDCRKTRFLYYGSQRRRHRPDGVFRQGTDQGRAGCFFFPVRRTESYL